MQRIPFHRPTIEEADIPGVLEVLRSGWLTTGPKCRQFEAEFAEYLGGDVHCIAVNSGTAAMHLALEAFGLGPGDKVLTTPYTFTSTAEVIRYLGADPVFVDVDERTFNLTLDGIRTVYESLSSKDRQAVKAVMPVHFGGYPCEIDAIEEWAHTEGLRVLDDAAHALPTRWKGKLIGRYADASAFSFYVTKTLCTGEGGMIVTPHEDLADRMRVMRLHGISQDVFDRHLGEKPSWHYEVIEPGFKYNMSDIAGVLGLSQLPRVDVFAQRREEVARFYSQGLAGVDSLTLPVEICPAGCCDHSPCPGQQSWHLYPLRVLGGIEKRNRFIEQLSEMGITTSVHFIPLHLQPYYRKQYGLQDDDFPVASRLFEQEVSLPIYPSLSRGELEYIVSKVREAIQ